jgi:hypothetical protein
MSRPEVLRALQAARAAPAVDELAAPVTTAPPPSPPVDAAPPGPSAGSTSSPAPAPPASTLPRPGATTETFTNAGAAPSTTTSVTVAVEPRATSTTTTTAKKNPTTSTTRKPTTTTTAKKDTTTTTAPPKDASRPREQSISSRGGVVTVRWSDGKVKFVVAHPKAGYEMKVWDNGPDRVVVSFYKDGHASWVSASYRDGSPVSQVVECSASRNHICR